jgi:hypothetical protein
MGSFTGTLMHAEAIREIRARGCTTPGVAELLTRRHGAHHILSSLHRIEELLEAIFIEDSEIGQELRELLERHSHDAVSSTLTFLNSKGETMDLTVHVNDKPGTAVYQEFDGANGTGNKLLPPMGAIVYASSDSTVATVDPSTGALAYLQSGTTTISASDRGNLPASAVLTVVAAAAVSSTMTLNPGV